MARIPLTKIVYTIYLDPEDSTFVYKYRDGVCVRVFDQGAWSRVEIERRFPQEVDIPDAGVLLFAGGLP